jgi:hypothetical protein
LKGIAIYLHEHSHNEAHIEFAAAGAAGYSHALEHDARDVYRSARDPNVREGLFQES